MADDVDQIARYVTTVAAGVQAFCPSCGRPRGVWVAETTGGDTLTVCGTCQRIIQRERTAVTPPDFNELARQTYAGIVLLRDRLDLPDRGEIAARRAIVDLLARVWNARGAADLDALEPVLGANMDAERRALGALDR